MKPLRLLYHFDLEVNERADRLLLQQSANGAAIAFWNICSFQASKLISVEG